MTPITMQLANADEADMDTALHIGGLLNDLDDCNSPFRHCSIRTLESIDNPDAETEPENALEDFDHEDGKHCQIFVERLLKLLDRRPGCLNRVLWGFSTLRYNNILDLESDHLALHPNLIAAKGKATKYDADIAELNQRLIDRTTGMQDVIQAQQLEIAQLKAKEKQLEWLYQHCKIIHWPKTRYANGASQYPIEHAPAAGKYSRWLLEAEMNGTPIIQPPTSN